VQKNARPNHPMTCGKVERFQQTVKNWLRAQPDQPASIDQLQTMLDRFVAQYNQHRPHREPSRV
jgi:transposase InsO family protein